MPTTLVIFRAKSIRTPYPKTTKQNNKEKNRRKDEKYCSVLLEEIYNNFRDSKKLTEKSLDKIFHQMDY